MTIYTFGHSTLEGPKGAELLRQHGIKVLIDVRSHPTSKWKQWRKGTMEDTGRPRHHGWLRKEKIRYLWWPELGGWDVRHLPEAPKFECYGVDIPTYAKGKFPKQRIAANRSMGTDPRCPSHGYSSSKVSGNPSASRDGKATLTGSRISSEFPSDGASHPRLRGQSAGRKTVSHRSKRTDPHNEPELPLASLPDARGQDRSAAGGRPGSRYTPQPASTYMACTPADDSPRSSGTDQSDGAGCTCCTGRFSLVDPITGEPRPQWTSVGLWDYQFFMTLPEFKDGLTKLMLYDDPNDHCAIMCCELLWWKCHRSMIADCLAFFGVEATHIQPKLTVHQNALGNRLERYHPDVIATWEKWKLEIRSQSGRAA